MKKSGLIVASLVLAGAAAMAQTPVYSVNTVGYQKLNVYTLTCFAANWNQVGGSDAIPVQNLVDKAPLTGGGDFFSSDELLVYVASLNAGQGGYKAYYKWSGDGQWYEFLNDNSPTTDTVYRGQGFWIKHIGSQTNVVVAGEVPQDATNVVVFGAGTLNQFGSAYTADMPLNGSGVQWTGNGGPDFFGSDTILAWQPTLNAGQGGYKAYYLWNSDGQWYEFLNDNSPTTDTLAMGAGAWYRNKGPSSSSLTQTRPY